MEPQLFSCGLDIVLSFSSFCILSFNGAATFQLRIVIPSSLNFCLLSSLQWSRNFSVADWSCTLASWTTDLSPSMEPQLFSCGLPSNQPCSYHRWNSLQWSRNFSVADCRLGSLFLPLRLWSFNGAATFQLRIVAPELYVDPTIKPSMEPQLFSCGLLIMSVRTRSGDIMPSMEPQLFSCGLFIASLSSNRAWALQWSRNFSVADCGENVGNAFTGQKPSMEPQLFSCGLWKVRLSVIGAFPDLQWSRNFSVADWITLPSYGVITFGPSMEPQLFSCGLLSLCLFLFLNSVPSMEPQLFSCGLLQSETQPVDWIPPFNGAATFQLRIERK